MTRLLRAFWAGRSGAAAVEFALVSLVFVVFALGIVDFGRNFYQKNRLAHAADIVSRELLLRANRTAVTALDVTAILDGATAGVFNYARFGQFNYDDIQAQVTTLAGGAYLRIVLSVPLRLLTPGVATSAGTISVTRILPKS